jgi:hypothetical protein
MKANLRAILSAVGVAPLLAFPAMAETPRPHDAAPATIYIPSDARGSITPYVANEGGPYTPSIPPLRYDWNRDFHGRGGDR